MDRLSLNDQPPMQQQGPPLGPGTPMGGNALLAPAPVPQLPPQMFTTSASLLELTDSKSARILYPWKHIVGMLVPDGGVQRTQ